jgi:hypothetical protein
MHRRYTRYLSFLILGCNLGIPPHVELCLSLIDLLLLEDIDI